MVQKRQACGKLGKFPQSRTACQLGQTVLARNRPNY